ncbi:MULTISPECIES: hypothetical protein [Proteus]|uniref:Uncharacterized protein n=1 Tax=Proteus penneri TaxID=102862 RepID=A0ABS0VZJ9_9GAMM|nr:MULTISPECIES: hypothetical protein [Proteus]MBJ2116152.1 hypothetical protein [Proteus penneri]NBM97229.1 hypothetical protein [Proteus sp. G2660]QPT34304.1 hypothetical protein I6G31_02475 [Proteus penneri]
MSRSTDSNPSNEENNTQPEERPTDNTAFFRPKEPEPRVVTESYNPKRNHDMYKEKND